jgi:hypothetical protein
MLQPGPTVGSHDDQVAADLPCDAQDFRGWFAFGGSYFALNSAVERQKSPKRFPQGDKIALGMSPGRHHPRGTKRRRNVKEKEAGTVVSGK